eukprot:TRINITY_DN437_c0_g2_i10.p4 TRINITY_DN437_c0_g2~~TRINITY_DN437_c0_g2_i10.p4  ORF type:complete len:152 (+),score=18.70 TRINITY_DN437_c0_g2_i10:866-1321(+)
MVPRRAAWVLAAVVLVLAIVSFRRISMLQRRLDVIEKAGGRHSSTGNYVIFDDTDLPGMNIGECVPVESFTEAEAVADARSVVAFTYVPPWKKVCLKSSVPAARASPSSHFCISGVRHPSQPSGPTGADVPIGWMTITMAVPRCQICYEFA